MAYRPTVQTLAEFESLCVREYVEMKPELKLKGAKKPMSEDERRFLAYLRAALRVLTKEGAISHDWIKKNETDDRDR